MACKEEALSQRQPNWKIRFVEWVKRESSFTDWCVAAFTCGLFFASIYQFIILNGQLDVMRKDQRAWISVTNEGTHQVIGEPIVVGLTVKNTGKTIAKDVHGIFQLEILNNDTSPHFDYSNKEPLTRLDAHVFFPDDKAHEGITAIYSDPATHKEQRTILTQDLSQKFTDGKIWFSAEGAISYEDIFGNRHWTHICFIMSHTTEGQVYSSPVGTQKCGEYNDTDD